MDRRRRYVFISINQDEAYTQSVSVILHPGSQDAGKRINARSAVYGIEKNDFAPGFIETAPK
jgi:hypothetical protein